MDELNTRSTDAMHWSKQLVKTAKNNNFTLEQVLDESWLVAWFANYWAAINDPLQSTIEAQEAEIGQLREALESRTNELKEYYVMAGIDFDKEELLKEKDNGCD